MRGNIRAFAQRAGNAVRGVVNRIRGRGAPAAAGGGGRGT